MNTKLYLDRIKFNGELEPTKKLLWSLHHHHVRCIPFENLDIHYDTLIVLDTNNIFNKIVLNKRGGFCYELNGLFHDLLAALGFNVYRVSARVYNHKEELYAPEFDHLALIVEINKREYLVDVGCGEFILEPLLLELNIEQEDPHGTFIIDQYKTYYRVSKLTNGIPKVEYIFTKIPRQFEEFNGRCTYQQTDPDAHFMKKKVITLPTASGRKSVTGHLLKIRTNGETVETVISGEEAFYQVLQDHFDIRL